MGVDQNKGIWGSYNRRSTANQSRSQRCQSRESALVCNTIVRRESSKHCYISQYLETWREPGPTQAGLTIAAQSRINREPIADFVDIFLRIELIWAGRLWTLLFWFFFAIGYHYWTQCLGKPEYSVRLNCNMIIIPYNTDFSSSILIQQMFVSIANQSPINRDAGLYNRKCWDTHALS